MEDRLSRLQVDIANLTSLANDCVYLKIKSQNDDSLHLELFNPFEEQCSKELIFSFSTADYPESTVVSVVRPSEEIRAESRPLLELIATECYKWCVEFNLEVPAFASRKQLDAEEERKSAPQDLIFDTQVSMTSEYSEACDTDEYDNYDGFDSESSVEYFLSPLLEKEIVCVQRVFGENSIESRVHAGIDEMDLFFNIDMNNLLDTYTGSAWRVNLDRPFVILLHIRSISKYLDAVEPMVEVFQESTEVKGEKLKAGVGLQMKKIMETFVIHQWKDLTNSRMEEILKKLDDRGGPSISQGASIRHDKHKLSAPALNRQSSLGAQVSLFPTSGSSEADKAIPSIENGFLVQFLQYALNRIHSLNEYCVICDERHVLESGLLKPCVCCRELCVFAFQTLGVMADAAEAIATDADVVDLLIAMANAAAKSDRCNLILDPYPSVVDPKDSSQLALDPKNKDFDLVRKVLDDVVKCRVLLMKGRATNIQKTLNAHHNLAYPLMQWIIATCRAHIVLLPQGRLLKSMKTKYQFLLVSSPPKKEAAFKAAKKNHGSTFAFHGSNIENWHSILRKSLINASGTKYQLHGAAHGHGIYLSPKSNVSFGYASSHSKPLQGSKSSPSTGYNQECLAGKLNLRCLTLCEVITSKDLKKNNDIWVCPNSDYVCTRFFFVYDTSTSVSIDTASQKFQNEIDNAMAYINILKGVT